MNEYWSGLIYQGKDYSSRLEVSTNGQIRNKKTKHIYKLNLTGDGYLGVCISLGSRSNKKMIKVHKAVAETFIPNPNNLPQVNHINGNKLNNYSSNLEWCTNQENQIHAIKNGLKTYDSSRGIKNINSKFSKEDVVWIRNNYIPNDKEFGCRALANKFGVSHVTISKIINYLRYKDIK